MRLCELETCRQPFEPKKDKQRYCTVLCSGTHGRNQARANRIAGRLPDGPLPATRAEARRLGVYLYFGPRCKYGHMDGRYTSTAKCVRCWAERTRRDKKPGAKPRPVAYQSYSLGANWAPVQIRSES